MYSSWSLLLSSFLLTLLTRRCLAQQCTNDKCPDTAPCCSEFGYCGAEHFCYGGCNPFRSYSISSCKPNPVCQDGTYTFDNPDRILKQPSSYQGEADKWDWILDSGEVSYTNSSGGEAMLTLTRENNGTRISSTRYVHYGSIVAKMKTGRWNGVVTAFITMSGIKDEIDWEFPGNRVSEGQTNYFWQGYFPVNTSHGETHKGLSDAFQNYHTYGIDWSAEKLDFSIDGQVVRTVQHKDTKDSSGIYQYPVTPSRIQLSVWPAGLDSVASGTVQWAGGMINWDDPDYQSAGSFSASIQSVTVKCGDTQGRDGTITGYKLKDDASMENPNVELVGVDRVSGNTFVKNAFVKSGSKMRLRVPHALLICAVLAVCLL